ncbi:MAG: hypothetical protein KGL39_39005, partial [Patescibacteria group bacterium]|nr:hypothetical protein [Patescibacteria group bacterium]
GAPSTDDESLKELILNRKWPSMGSPEKIALESLVSARKNLKLVSMLAGYENNAVNLGDHWRIYPHYFSWRTTTHRSTADKGFQLWPHDKRVRGLLTARPGHVLLACDYSQLQMRIAADLSQSESMKRLFTDKIDPHSWLAAQIIGEPDWTKIDKDSEARYCAKPCNFLLLFGAQPFTLRRQALTDYGLVWTEEQAKKYHDIFHDAYKLDPWYSRVAKELKDTGAIRSPLGAIRHLPNIHAGEAKQREEALRQAINAPVQDVEVMIAYLALWECYMAGYNIVAFLHDALYIEVLAELEDESKNQIAYIMETRVPEILDQDYGYKLSVPLEVDIKTTPCYDRV